MNNSAEIDSIRMWKANKGELNMNITDEELQRELAERIATHKLAITNAYWYNQYLQAEENAPIQLPSVIAEKNAKEFSNTLTAQILMSGAIEDEYNKAWFYLADTLP